MEEGQGTVTATARTIIGVGLIAALLAGAASANVFPDAAGRDPRALEPRSNWSPVALVYSNVDRRTGERRPGPTGAPGTGFMISPCYLLTNYHVALGEVAARGASPDVRLTVWLGSPARAYQAVIHADGNLGSGQGFGDGDWVLARVEGCPGRRRDVGWLPMMKASFIAIDNKVVTAGFPKDRGYPQIAVHRDCVIRARTESGALIHDCAVSNGQSGSPLLFPGKVGLAVIGMVTGEIEPSDEMVAYRPDHQNANYAIPVGDILEQPKVAAVVTADLTRAGRNSFVPRARR